MGSLVALALLSRLRGVVWVLLTTLGLAEFDIPAGPTTR